MITCILLSAGSSSRFGSPKALAHIYNNTIIESLQTKLLKTDLNNIIIVLGAHNEKIQPFVLKHKRIKVVYNKDYNFGQTSSFKCGLKNIEDDTNAIMLLPVDFPLIKNKTIDLLIKKYSDTKPSIIIPSYKDKKGHPPIFNIDLKNEFLRLDNSEGINSVSHKYKEKTTIVPVEDIGVVLSFNTKKELKKIKELNSN